jgi:hypothetical protein
MFFTVALDVLILAYFLSRQLRVRQVPRLPRMQFSLILGVIGLIEFFGYTGHHHVTNTEYAWFAGTLIVGAGLLGAVRAMTVKIWVSNNWVFRQGTWLTMTLWLVSLALHFVIVESGSHSNIGNLETASLLLYVAVTYAVQNYVVHRRALPLWNSLGPEAGQGIQFNFRQGPGGGGAFFTTFRTGGPGATPPPSPPTHYDDPTIIDAEVVEDNEGPAELR